MKHFVFEHAPVQADGSAPEKDFYWRHGKRTFDLLLALIILPIIAPVMAVIWVVIWANGGTGFYCQTRIGRQGRPFKFWKFRTMVLDADRFLQDLCAQDPALGAEWRRNQKLAIDPRITKFGRFLRATSLDEVPQIWNVILGDMSFVGPRPFMASQDGLYRAAGGGAYYSIRPGITGPWQISDRGQTPFLGRIQFDNDYTNTVHCLGDIWLLFKTVGAVLKHTGR